MAQSRDSEDTVDQLTEVDVAEIMAQVRERASIQRRKFALSAAASPHRNSQVSSQATEDRGFLQSSQITSQATKDISFLQTSQDLSQVRFSSHRKVVGKIIVLAKNVLRQLLTPIWERQSAYNAVNARLMAYLGEKVPRLEEQLTSVEEHLTSALEAQQAQVTSALEAQQAQVASALEAQRAEETAFLDALRETITGQFEILAQQQAATLQALQLEVASQSRDRRAQERHLTLLLDEARKRLAEPLSQQPLQTHAHGETRPSDAFFAAFDERFRGSRVDIKMRLHVYLPTVKQAKVGTADNPIVDLGCGRGEWLELLHEEGMQGKGVERNRVLVEECRQAGLDVIESDILTYLCALPNSSIGAVTGFHIIEHLPFEVLLDLFDETVRVLQPGGVAIFETPNPQNVLVSTLEFYNDPTHRTPLPSTLLKFIAEVKGLQRIKLLQLHPFPQAHKVDEGGLDIAKRFNELFYGPQDYALVGWKP